MPNATLERPGGADIKITVTLQPEDYRKPAEAELKRLAKQVKLKGFRPGMVPVAHVRKMYGRSVMADAVGKAVDTAINDLVKEEKLDIFGQLQPTTEPDFEVIDAGKDALTFVYEGGVLPKVESVDTSALKDLNRYTVKLTDEEATERLEGSLKNFMEYIERDTVETADDFATLVVADAELDAMYLGEAGAAHSAEPTVGNDAKDDAAGADSAEHDGDAEEHAVEVVDEDDKEADPRQRYFLRAADLEEEQRYKLIDKARGTEVILSLVDLKEETRERFKKAIDEDGTTSFTIAKVDRENLPELNEEAFKKIFGEETTVTTEEEAKNEFSTRFADNSQRNLDDFALEQLIDKLSETNEVAVPEAAIKHRLEQARADEVAKAAKEDREPQYAHDLTEADRHGLTRRLKWMAFRQHLVDKYEIELASEDIDKGIERAYIEQFAKMGIDPNQYRAQFFPMFKKNLLENREQVMELTDGLLSDKLLQRLEEEGVIGERQHVGENAFGDIVEKYNERVGAELDALREQPLA